MFLFSTYWIKPYYSITKLSIILHISGPGVLAGDSGDGYSVMHDQLYYLTGIAITKDVTENDSYAVFTDVYYHIDWIKSVYNNYSEHAVS